ncbi:MAG: metalloprotease TldD [Alphaproteobacteria bacterium]|nr:metalloprotease TldD [Alphaproteobacteria bacterium]
MKSDSLIDDMGPGVDAAARILGEAVAGADDGEIYVESVRSESFMFDDGRLKSASYDSGQGFGLRVVSGETTGYAHASEVSEAALKRAATAASAAKRGRSGVLALGPTPVNRRLYADVDPTESLDFTSKTNLLAEIDAWCRAADPRVVQVSVSLAGSRTAVEIIRAGGATVSDARPLVRLNVAVTMEKDGRRETGSAGAGGRAAYEEWVEPARWKGLAQRALRKAEINLDSVPAPSGEMEVALGPGWTGVMLHEAVGHGLEGDFNRKGTSVYSGKIGQQVMARGVNIVDDGTIQDRRGSLSFDDEGTQTQRTVLIEDGVLVGYMQDRMNARLMGVPATGNGRRESYAHAPMPRMTNTVMLGGTADPEEIVRSIKKGIWAVDFGGGQVDITNGQFVFQCTEAYLVENGKVGPPVKNATLIGHGPTVLNKVSMIGNDFAMDDGVGTCGKAGQSVPVGVGQPSLKIDVMTVGGAGG